jgi:hypothetical protein
VYTGAIRPIMEYASSSWSTVDKTNKTKLNKIQNWGLRLILGVIKTTPVKDMEKTTNIDPLENRRNYKLLTQAEKSRRTSNHPLHDRLQKQPLERLKRKSLSH